jgi:hypothetical protein
VKGANAGMALTFAGEFNLAGNYGHDVATAPYFINYFLGYGGGHQFILNCALNLIMIYNRLGILT